MRWLLLLIGSVLFSNSLLAQSGNIEGIVMDKELKQPVSGTVIDVGIMSAGNMFNTPPREAQLNTGSRPKSGSASVSEIHFTPGTPRFIKAGIVCNF